MKLTLSIPDKLIEEFDKVRGLVPRSTAIQGLLKKSIEIKNRDNLKQVETLMDKDLEPTSDGQKLQELAKDIQQTEKILYPVKSNCKNCNMLKMVSPHTFIFGYDQERITDNLCDTCWQKARQDGTAR